MTVDETDRTIHPYLDSLQAGGDFAAYFADDVTWTTMETGDQIRGREPVRDFIVALHSQLFDATPEFGHVTVTDGVARSKRCSSGSTPPSSPASRRPAPRSDSLLRLV